MWRPTNPGAPPNRRRFPPIGGPDDHFSRAVQAVCGVLLLAAGCFGIYLTRDSPDDFNAYQTTGSRWGLGLAGACVLLGLRCLWYAVTGKDNVNRDDF